MAKRPCAGCQAVPVIRGYCEKCQHKAPAKLAEQRRTRERDPRIKGWYDSQRWRSKRLGHLRKYPLCVGYPDAAVHAGRPVAAVEVDHVVPHKGDYELFWAGKLQGLCKACHGLKTAREDGGFGRAVRVPGAGTASEGAAGSPRG